MLIIFIIIIENDIKQENSDDERENEPENVKSITHKDRDADLENKKKELAKIQDKLQQNNTPNKSNNKGLYISLAVAGVLLLGIIAYFLLRNKDKKDYE